MTGDVEGDFWLSLDLLRSAKDHAEFALVRDWVRNALQVGTGLSAPLEHLWPSALLTAGTGCLLSEITALLPEMLLAVQEPTSCVLTVACAAAILISG